MDIKGMVLIIIGVVSVSLILAASASSLGAEYTEMGQGIAGISTALAFFGIALYALASSEAPTGTLVIVGGLAGVIFAFILKSLNDSGILIDEFITGSITIADLMTVVVVFWLIVGILLEVMRR